jgi:hypothetical protein
VVERATVAGNISEDLARSSALARAGNHEGCTQDTGTEWDSTLDYRTGPKTRGIGSRE